MCCISLEKLKRLVSIMTCPWRFVTLRRHVHSENWYGTLQAVQSVCCEVKSKLTCWCARTLCCLCPPPIFERYKIAFFLSICKRIATFDFLFVNVRTANFAAINPEYLYVSYSPFSTIYPSWHPVALWHDFDATVFINLIV